MIRAWGHSLSVPYHMAQRIKKLPATPRRMRYTSESLLENIVVKALELPLDKTSLKKVIPAMKTRLQMMETLEEMPMGEDDLKGVSP